MYKDSDKQREANAERQRRYKARQKALLEQGVTPSVTPAQADVLLSKVLGEPERTAQGNIRVSKPGDADYEPQCETTRAFIEGRPKRPPSKRGKDIKCFADLPPDVQKTIHQQSTTNEGFKKRTAAAIKYQHIFSGIMAEVVVDRFYSTGLA